jgi:hypothetical protein
MGAGDIGHQRHSPLLVRRQPGFHEVNKVGHSGQEYTFALPALAR